MSSVSVVVGNPDGQQSAGFPFTYLSGSEGPNDFYNEIAALPQTVFKYPLRSESQIAPYRRGNVTDPANSLTYSPQMDAAMWTLPAGAWSVRQCWLPTALPGAIGQTVIIWDWHQGTFTRENGIIGYKQFQNRRVSTSKDGSITFEIGSRFDALTDQSQGGTLLSRLRLYPPLDPVSPSFKNQGGFTVDKNGKYNLGSSTSGLVCPCVLYNSDSSGPVRNYWLPRGAWGRFMLEFVRNGDGLMRANYWAIDSTNKTLMQIYANMTCPDFELKHFDFELNSSTSTPRQGPQVQCYGRNVLVLRNIANPSSLLRAPVAA